MTNNKILYDLYAAIQCQKEEDIKAIIQGRINGQDIPDIYARIQLLAPALITSAKDQARTGSRQGSGGYKSLIFAKGTRTTPFEKHLIDNTRELMASYGTGLWQPATPDFTLLPPYSAFLQFTFELTKPYISRDDELFHISDNPIRKDKVFKVPMVAATGWKGNLRWTARQLEPELDQQTMNRLFGPEKEDEDTHLAGRLHFYPTFFDRMSLEVINPHDRATRAGKYPIYFESVPTGTEGIFSLLYVPLPGSIHSEQEAREDLRIVTSALYQMLCIYGFSAKKSSGFGEVADKVRDASLNTMGRSVTFSRLSELESKV
jgi:CRISPR-associated protein Cmr2